MSNLYPKGIDAAFTKKIDLVADDIRVVLVDLADYTYAASHEFLSDIPAAARVAVTAALTGKSMVGGVFDAADTVFTGAAGDQSEALIIYQHTGTATTSRLIDFIDAAGGTLPVIPNGGDLTVTWSNGANKIFAIAG